MERLYYRDSGEEVKLGDRFIIRPLFFGRIKYATVKYIPREVPPPEEDCEFWTWQLDDGSIVQQIYTPEELQPSKRFSLVSRAERPVDEVGPEEVEALAQAQLEENPVTFGDMAWLLALGLAVVFLIGVLL